MGKRKCVFSNAFGQCLVLYLYHWTYNSNVSVTRPNTINEPEIIHKHGNNDITIQKKEDFRYGPLSSEGKEDSLEIIVGISQCGEVSACSRPCPIDLKIARLSLRDFLNKSGTHLNSDCQHIVVQQNDRASRLLPCQNHSLYWKLITKEPVTYAVANDSLASSIVSESVDIWLAESWLRDL